MVWTEKDNKMLNGSIEIFANLFERIRNVNPLEAVKDLSQMPPEIQKIYIRKDGKDTLSIDILAEKSISIGYKFVGHNSLFHEAYNQSGVIITEERGKVGSARIEHSTPVIISDPTDRSSYLESIIQKYGPTCATMGEAFDKEVEAIGLAHARLEACNSSVTLLKDNMIKYTVVLNLFTGETFIAFDKGVFSGDIKTAKSVEDFKQDVEFKDYETMNMLCYLEGCKYENNFNGARLRFFPIDRSIKSPGGPNRFTYLLKEPAGQNTSSIGVIAHNGEKIQESLPNIAIAYFSKGRLAAYKLYEDTFHEHRADRELTPNFANSIYDMGLIKNTGLKLTFLNNYDYPSQFRDTTLIVPTANESAMTMMEGMVKREFAIRIV